MRGQSAAGPLQSQLYHIGETIVTTTTPDVHPSVVTCSFFLISTLMIM